jgi:hypothetical protein
LRSRELQGRISAIFRVGMFHIFQVVFHFHRSRILMGFKTLNEHKKCKYHAK